jgi:site-specific recombinase XerD
MHDELFQTPAIVERYRAAPHAESREHFLRKASEEGHSRSMLQRMAWALLVVAQEVNIDAGPVSVNELERALRRRTRFKNSINNSDSEHTIQVFLRTGKAWLRAVGALRPKPESALRFAAELRAFVEYMRDERGLSPVTITDRAEQMRWFFTSLPSSLRALRKIRVEQIDRFLDEHAQRGWTRRSLHVLGSNLRSFFRYAAQRGWCSADLASGIDLPTVYALEDVPQAPTAEEVRRILDATSATDDPVKIRDHAVLSLLASYGLRCGEVERLTLEDLDWVAEKIHITRPKLRRAQWFPLSAPVGEAILRYLRRVRPRCGHRALFLTINAPFRPLSAESVSAMVRMRLAEQGVTGKRRGAHCLRHACAGQLLNAGFTMKEIADHIGHQSMDTTRIYTKIDLVGLREVAELDVGGLL